MRARVTAIGLLVMTLASVTPSSAQLARTDAIWARTVAPGSITLDGNLNEAVWAQAESWRVHYGYDYLHPVTGTQGIPGSGWKDEGGYSKPGTFPTSDSTNATLRFLVMGNKLYLGATVPDKSIGGGGWFNYLDGFLMGLKDHADPGFPKPINEYMYSWWYPRTPDTVCPCAADLDSAVGNPPVFKGRWAPDPVCDCVTGQVAARTAEQIAAWDARTVINGITNDDAHGVDVGYTVEMVFDLGVMGYDVTKAAGDTIEWNISIYDTDNYWKTPLGFDLSRNRTWWQNPWARDAFHDEVRIYARPSVTNTTSPLPAIGPDFTISSSSAADPTIDGNLGDAAWSAATSFDIRYDDNALRGNYPSIGKYRSGQFQPRLSINDPDPAPLPFVVNGGDATVKLFYKGDFLYAGFDVRDTRIQSNAFEDLWDGLVLSITHRTFTDPEDHNMQGEGLAFHVGQAGNAVPADTLPQLIADGKASLALQLKPGSTVDSTGTTGDDTGYTAELKVDLKALGYPAGLGDKTMFLGVTLYDHDRYSNPLSESYSTRTWWFRERKETCCPAWTLLQSAVGVEDGPLSSTAGFRTLGNSPNPFQHMTTLEFALGRESNVRLQVFDLGGRLVTERDLGWFAAGNQKVPVQLPSAKSGVYLYRLKAQDPGSGAVIATLTGKMMHLR